MGSYDLEDGRLRQIRKLLKSMRNLDVDSVETNL